MQRETPRISTPMQACCRSPCPDRARRTLFPRFAPPAGHNPRQADRRPRLRPANVSAAPSTSTAAPIPAGQRTLGPVEASPALSGCGTAPPPLVVGPLGRGEGGKELDVAGATPAPARAAVCRLAAVLSGTFSFAERAPTAPGVNRTPIVHESPGTTVAPEQ